MLFNSFNFIIFLPIVFLLYWYVFKSLRWQNLFVVAASYVFYGWWDWRFLLLIALTTFCSYESGLLLERSNGNRKRQKLISAANISLNLLILAYFKYCNFFGENFTALLRLFGIETDWVMLEIMLPVGISFYTFQALSYTIDVYRKKISATHDIVSFFAFVSFFPQLVAGPIERASNLLPQFAQRRHFDYCKAADGMRQILWGLFKKMVVADNCAIAVNSYFLEYSMYDGFNLFVGAVLFSFQIYGDFSGYSDMAIGTAKLFGINLMRNFNYPYFSRDIAEFWRRWHISLTTWFRDYIYIPLGGSRCSKWKVMRNTLIIFLVSGFWHGANWTFVCWGVYHAMLFFPLFLLGKNRKHTNNVATGKMLPSAGDFIRMLLTFMLVMVGWIIFRAETMSQAYGYLYAMVRDFHYSEIVHGKKAIIYCFLMLSLEWIQREKMHGLQLSADGLFSKHPVLRWGGIYILLSIFTLLFAGFTGNFIYFQF